MAWVLLFVAAAFEVVFATSMKASEGFTKLWPSVITVFGVIGGVGCLTLALKDLPVSVGYPVWVGIGTLGTVIVGMTVFGEGMTPLKAAGTTAVVAGVIALRIADSGGG